MDLAMVNHLFVTPRFLVKGRIATGDLRLSSFLTSYRRPFLNIDDLSLLEWSTNSRIVAAQGQVRFDDIVLAHEFLEVSGDSHRKAMAEEDEQSFQMASLYLRAPCPWELFGRVKRDVVQATGADTFLVVRDPEIRGLESEAAEELELLARLPYLILNGNFVHCMFRYE